MPGLWLGWPDFLLCPPPPHPLSENSLDWQVELKSELIWKKYEIHPKGEKPDKTLLNSESSVDKAN